LIGYILFHPYPPRKTSHYFLQFGSSPNWPYYRGNFFGALFHLSSQVLSPGHLFLSPFGDPLLEFWGEIILLSPFFGPPLVGGRPILGFKALLKGGGHTFSFIFLPVLFGGGLERRSPVSPLFQRGVFALGGLGPQLRGPSPGGVF